MANRLDLHDKFIDILGTKNEVESRVYFQPPASLKMKYPCIRYSKSTPRSNYANDGVYKTMNKYDGVVIDPNPDSVLPDEILHSLPMCSLGDPYAADNLNHFPFTLYF
jgi:hypothetical protein